MSGPDEVDRVPGRADVDLDARLDAEGKPLVDPPPEGPQDVSAAEVKKALA
jgi:hypothetical protein